MGDGQQDSGQELLERFMAAVSGGELDDLRDLPAQLTSGPSRRRSRRDEPVALRVRVELEASHPSIWRRLDLRSDLTLDAVHDVLQAAFGWYDAHLHRFAIGRDAFDPEAEAFLCPFEVAEGDVPGVPESEVRLDETLVDPGDQLRYCYDYGDAWELVLTLEEVRPADDGTPHALCLDGGRAAPPEDCGGLRTAEQLAAVLADPEHFDRTEVNAALTGPSGELTGSGLRPELLALLTQLRGTAVGEELAIRAWGLGLRAAVASPAQRSEALEAIGWFLERLGDEGVPLTAAGYLKPVDVAAIVEKVPQGREWRGPTSREVDTAPVRLFREQLHALGLVRKHSGRLLATRAGRAARADDHRLWNHLADRLPMGTDRDGTRAAGLVVLLLLASSPHPTPLAYATVAEALSALGWREGDTRRPITAETARRAAQPTLRALRTLMTVDAPVGRSSAILAAAATDLAAHALVTAR